MPRVAGYDTRTYAARPEYRYPGQGFIFCLGDSGDSKNGRSSVTHYEHVLLHYCGGDECESDEDVPNAMYS